MRSDTGAKEYSPEPLQAHITKCSTLRLLCSVSTLHAEITNMERGRLVKMGWMSVCIFLFLCVCGRRLWTKSLVWVTFKSIPYVMVSLHPSLPILNQPHGRIKWRPSFYPIGDAYKCPFFRWQKLLILQLSSETYWTRIYIFSKGTFSHWASELSKLFLAPFSISFWFFDTFTIWLM